MRLPTPYWHDSAAQARLTLQPFLYIRYEAVFDPAREATKGEKHGISLRRAADMDIALVIEDDRFDYEETRYRALGFIDDERHGLVFTVRDEAVCVISLRRAGDKEIERYAATKESKQRRGESGVDGD